MIISATIPEIKKALEKANEKVQGNLMFAEIVRKRIGRDGDPKTKVRLTVKSSRAQGAKRTASGRRVAAACWHAHGYFFDSLPEGTKIQALNTTFQAGDVWRDWNEQSMGIIKPTSQCCDCHIYWNKAHIA
jgi:hypothetical protein